MEAAGWALGANLDWGGGSRGRNHKQMSSEIRLDTCTDNCFRLFHSTPNYFLFRSLDNSAVNNYWQQSTLHPIYLYCTHGEANLLHGEAIRVSMCVCAVHVQVIHIHAVCNSSATPALHVWVNCKGFGSSSLVG